MLAKSSQPILLQIKRQKKSKKKSVTAVFSSGIKKLMRNLNATSPYFVRCINPNKHKSNEEWDGKNVEGQLRCGGLIEALKVLKLGYPTRVPYNTLYEKYHGSVENPLIKNMQPAAFSTSLLIAFDVDSNDYELGLTKIFFKPAKAAILDTIMSKAGQPLTAEQNAKITTYIVGKRVEQLMGALRVFVQLKRQIRMRRAAISWEWCGRITSTLGATVCKHLQIAREKIKVRKRLEAANAMQAMYRGYTERINYQKRLEMTKDAVGTIYLAYRAMKQRKGLRRWVDEQVEDEKQRKERLRKEEEERKIREAKEAALNAMRMEKEAKQRAEQKEETVEMSLDEAIALSKKKQQMKSEEIQKEKQVAKQEKQKLTLQRMDTVRMNNKSLREEQSNVLKEKSINEREQNIMMKAHLATVLDLNESSSDSDFETESDDDAKSIDVEALLGNFKNIAASGQIFHRHAANRRGRPKKSMVKVSFDENSGEPLALSWGKAGSKNFKFSDIWYITYGLHTPNFLHSKNDNLDEDKCLSVVGRSPKKVLDLEAYTKKEAKTWALGLRQLIGQSNEKADELAMINRTQLEEHWKKRRKKAPKKEALEKVVQMQQDLFVMTVDAVYEELEQQQIWIIDAGVKREFSSTNMYKQALAKDIPWRKWQWFVREQITTYLKEHDLVQTSPTAVQPRDPQKPKYTRNDNQRPSTRKLAAQDDVVKFLGHYQLLKYNVPLRANGLKSLSSLKSLPKAEIAKICDEVQMNTLHRNNFIKGCMDLKEGKYPPKKEQRLMAVDKWLDDNDLFKYSIALKDAGLTSLEDISKLKPDEVAALAQECTMGVLHKKKFFAACADLQQKKKKDDGCRIM